MPSFLLALAQPTATRINLLARVQPQETQTGLRTVLGERP